MITRIKGLVLISFLSGNLLYSQKNESSIGTTNDKVKAENHIYFGDIHNHCNLTYGHGDMRDAFDAAKQQLDFLSVTPHAMWPDMPGKDEIGRAHV